MAEASTAGLTDRLRLRPGERLGVAIADVLARMIDEGALIIGSRLPPERELMKRFGISRAVVREAIAALDSRGLLLTRAGHRPIVRRPDYHAAIRTLGGLVRHLVHDEAGVWNLFETRVFLEAALVRGAALRAAPLDIQHLGEALEANRLAIGDHPRFYQTDVGFHGVFYRIPRNPIYPAMQDAYVEWLMRYWLALPTSVEIDRMNYAAHQAIYNAVLRRDADQAEQMLRIHLNTAWEFVRPTFSPSVNSEGGSSQG